MKNKANVYDYVLSMYVSENNLRPQMCKVFKQENYNIATDSYSVIFVDEKDSGLKYDSDDKSPKALHFLNDFIFDTTEVIDRNTFLSDFFTLERIWYSSTKACEKCDGSGSIECDCCGNDSDCKECDGSGDSYEKLPFVKPELIGDNIFLFDRKFSSVLTSKMIQTSYFLEAEKITVKFNKANDRQPFLFEIGEAKIIIMPTF